MRKEFAYLIGLGILIFFLFGAIFKLLQNDKIYFNTLGLVSENYERIGGWDNYEIKKTAKPYLPLNNDNFDTWDAAIYKCISERMYKAGDDCFGNVRSAFFPLFPILWKITNSSLISISIINYFLFIASIASLVIFLLKTTLPNKLIAYAALITLPSTIVYFIPYTEALFLFTTTLALIGMIKKKYWIFFAGSLLLAMVRPATVFVLFSIIIAELLILVGIKNYMLFIREALSKSLPFIVGYLCVIFIQYMYSGSWSGFIEAHYYWAGGVQPIKSISDWSVEGFGLSSFSIFFVCLPSLVFIFYLVHGWGKNTIRDFILKLKNYGIEYLFVISIFYLVGIFIFTLVTSGGNLHSFFRFTLASPFFYIAVLTFLNYLSGRPLKPFILSFILINISLFIFLNSVEYGGERLNFSFFGLYVFIATSLFLCTKDTLSRVLKFGVGGILIILNTVWNTYLLNAFLSNGWIFT